MRITTIDDFLDLLGGDAAVGKMFGVSYKAIAQWRTRRHIASAYHLKLLAIARKKGIAISPEVFGLPETEVGDLFHIAPISYSTSVQAA